MATQIAFNQLSLTPLGAGDLIDRAVRLYRRHFITLIRISAPPVIVTAIGSLMLTLSGRSKNEASAALLLLFGFLIWVGGVLLNLIVMGGAARNLITNLLWNEPFSARSTYRNVHARFGGLLGASIIVAIWIFLAFILALLFWALVIQIFIFGRYAVAGVESWFATVLVVVWVLAVTFLALLLFFLMVKFMAYVPQVLMVEGRGVFDSIGRSFTLARGNLRRLMAMFVFYWFATYSALMILIIPLMWYGAAHGININPSRAATWPVWFAIGYNVITQLSAILLVPVWMLGLSLMYVDERIRQEGYDIELMAARELQMPNLYAQTPSYPQTAFRQTVGYAQAPSQYYSPGQTRGLR
ncbi:MAG: hypothetical protein DMF68_10365 [Acidobacteria bacterium]|nr:MAG: hypothetical protein DMF68_10365 [Acidobacteriota bacterium]